MACLNLKRLDYKKSGNDHVSCCCSKGKLWLWIRWGGGSFGSLTHLWIVIRQGAEGSCSLPRGRDTPTGSPDPKSTRGSGLTAVSGRGVKKLRVHQRLTRNTVRRFADIDIIWTASYSRYQVSGGKSTCWADTMKPTAPTFPLAPS